MPEQRIQRTRATLPEGYQFGDALVKPPVSVPRKYRTCYEHSVRTECINGTWHIIEGSGHWNVIEGEDH
jgi:hypothetical protein